MGIKKLQRRFPCKAFDLRSNSLTGCLAIPMDVMACPFNRAEIDLSIAQSLLKIVLIFLGEEHIRSTPDNIHRACYTGKPFCVVKRCTTAKNIVPRSIRQRTCVLIDCFTEIRVLIGRFRLQDLMKSIWNLLLCFIAADPKEIRTIPIQNPVQLGSPAIFVLDEIKFPALRVPEL